MKVLFITNYLKPDTDANSDIAYKLAECLKEDFSVEPVILGLRSKYSDDKKPEDQLKVYYAESELKKISEKWPMSGQPLKRKLHFFLNHPVAAIYKIWSAYSKHPLLYIYNSGLKRVLKEEKEIKAIIAFSNPHETVLSAAKMCCNIPLYSYKLDPWATNICFNNKSYARTEEQWADSKSKHIFVTPVIYKEVLAGEKDTDKITAFEFPLIVEPKQTDSLSPYDESFINCVYAGTVYPKLRNPEFVFSIFSELISSGIRLHVVGNTKEQEDLYKERFPGIIFHGHLPAAEAELYKQHADILVNIGNNIPNQLPSKLVGYFAYGKPVIGTCKFDNCLTRPYLEKYPSSFIIDEYKGLSDLLVEKVKCFCLSSKGRKLPFGEVKKLFYECTPEYVCKKIYDTIFN